MKTLLILCLATLASLTLAVAGDDILVPHELTKFPCKGFKLKSGMFYNFKEAPFPVEFNVTLKSMDNKTDYEGVAVIAPCNNIQSLPRIEDDCPADFKIENAVGYYSLRKVGSLIEECFRIGDVTQVGEWKITLDTETSRDGIWQIDPKLKAENEFPYDVSFQFQCGTEERLINKSAIANHQDRVYMFKVQAKQVCPVNSGQMITYLYNHTIVPIIILPFALFIVFFGHYFVKAVLFIMGFLTGALGTLLCAVEFSNPVLWKNSNIIQVVLIGLIVSGLLGYIFSRYPKFYMTLAGGFLGYSLSYKGFEALVLAVGHLINLFQLITIIIFVVAGMVAGYYLHDHILILSTTFGGSFLVCISIGTIFKNYPDLENLQYYSNLDADAKHEFRLRFVAYSAAWLFLAVVGAAIQYYYRTNKPEDEDLRRSDTEDSYISYESEAVSGRNYY